MKLFINLIIFLFLDFFLYLRGERRRFFLVRKNRKNIASNIRIKVAIRKIFDVLSFSKNRTHNPKTLLIVKIDAIWDYCLFRNYLIYLKEINKYID